MLLFSLITNPLLFLIYIVTLLVALTVHEFAHAWTANMYGDPTAKLQGRMTLNPLAHLDFLGTVFLLIAGFGWGKPVNVNPRNFENPKLDNLTVSLAGPFSNLTLAVIFGLIYRFVALPPFLNEIFILLIFFNLVLMIFNLIPIPPLDGSKILSLFISEEAFLYLQQIGITLLFLLIIVSSLFFPIFPALLTRVVTFFFTIITGRPISL